MAPISASPGAALALEQVRKKRGRKKVQEGQECIKRKHEPKTWDKNKKKIFKMSRKVLFYNKKKTNPCKVLDRYIQL